MPREGGFLNNIYSVARGTEMQRYYDDWSDSYDAELAAQDYRTPERCAQALARHSRDVEAAVLDFACGTGLSGVALNAAGFPCIDGMDVSDGMLREARAKGVYRRLLHADPDHPLDLRDAGYSAIVACGAIGAGAAPAECLDWAIDSLGRGGLFVVSLNDHTLEDRDFARRLTAAAEEGRAAIVEDDHGPHLPALGLGARVYVLRRE